LHQMIISNDLSPFAESLLIWYNSTKRDLPWRTNTIPYSVWVSEVILQQTRVAQGMEFYMRFMAAFPTVYDLADAKEEEVLRLWQGLGYYSRAGNLLEAAKWVVNENRGQFPDTISGLLKMKGVGQYTAAAIGSICFGIEVPAIDGNALRVAARYFGIDQPINESISLSVFTEVLKPALSGAPPGDFNQAIMELGALICKPVNPRCSACPLEAGCVALAENTTDILPVKKKKSGVKEVYLTYAFLTHGERFLMRKRSEKGIWRNLWDFPSIESDSPVRREELVELFAEKLGLKGISVSSAQNEVTHLLTHRKLRIVFLQMAVEAFEIELSDYAWVSFSEAEKLPKPLPIANFLHKKFLKV